MNASLPLVDLSSIVAMVSSAAVVSTLLSGARTLFLDALLRGLSSVQRDYILRILAGLLNFVAILVVALLAGHYALSLSLLLSVAYYAAVSFGAGHLGYHLAVNTKKTSEPLYAEIPVDDDAASALPEPPTDDPASAALAA